MFSIWKYKTPDGFSDLLLNIFRREGADPHNDNWEWLLHVYLQHREESYVHIRSPMFLLPSHGR